MKNYSFFFTSQTFQGINRRKNTKLRFHYHQISKDYAERELEKLENTKVLEGTIFDQKSKNTGMPIDLKETEEVSDEKNEWAGSSVRIEHHPPKVGVVGSNPTPPATDKPCTLTRFVCTNADYEQRINRGFWLLSSFPPLRKSVELHR